MQAGAVWPPVRDAVEAIVTLGGRMNQDEPLLLISPQETASGLGHQPPFVYSKPRNFKFRPRPLSLTPVPSQLFPLNVQYL